jgi:uncharacterized protein YjbI with pentapeptide repeats
VKTFTQPELNRALAEHERHGHALHGFRTDLKQACLDGLNLANRDLKRIDFSGASLVGATLFGSNLSQARLFGADLRRSDLRNANLTGADLRGASLNRANLSFAKLDRADMRSVVMMKTAPDGMLIVDRQETLNGKRTVPRVGVDFSNASLKGVSFGDALLQGADFSGALLHGAVFRGAKLIDPVFRGAVLTGIDLKDLPVPPEALEGCILDVSQAAGEKAAALAAALDAHEMWVVSDGKQGAPAVLDGEDLRPLCKAFAGRRLTALCARKVLAIGVDFSRCQLQGAKFLGADLRDAVFSGADLAGASFREAKLAHAGFARAKIVKLMLLGGNHIAPDFAEAEIVEDQFQSAVVDQDVSEQLAAILHPDE